ncbi:MAG: hypothetical protein ACREFW_04590 [Rhizomicrobium sp.]
MTLAWIITRDAETVMWFDDKFRAEVFEWSRQGAGWALIQPCPMTMVLAEMELAGDQRIGADPQRRKRALRAAVLGLRDKLASDAITATAVAGGDVVVRIPADEWPRLGFYMDLHRDYIAFEHNPTPRYWRALLPKEQVLKVWPEVTTTVETLCEKWLRAAANASPEARPKTKDQLLTEAQRQFPHLLERAFNRAWANATKGFPKWRKPGRASGDSSKMANPFKIQAP